MSTLLLRLAAPMQAWGDESKYDIRQTRTEPSKSGVIGLLAAAIGLKRDSAEVAGLSAVLRMGVRVDMPGQLCMDYHTARPPKYRANGDLNYDKNHNPLMENAPYVTTRYYLCDACFLVGLESEDEALLDRLADALRAPCFPLFLGRRACPPTLPLLLNKREETLEEALQNEPWLASDWYKRKSGARKLRIILETHKGESAWHTLRDEPVSFSPVHRRYAHRGVQREQYATVFGGAHDPMSEL